MTQFSLVGNTSLTRRDLIPRITGARAFASDISAADIGASSMVYMGMVTCPYPSAKVKSIDVSKAEAAGFVTLTGAELPAYDYYGGSGRPFPPLSSNTVIFAGQAVAAVASSDPNGVTDALDLVKVTYEPQAYVFDPEEALSPNAPQLYEGGNSLIGPTPITTTQGEVETALAQEDQ